MTNRTNRRPRSSRSESRTERSSTKRNTSDGNNNEKTSKRSKHVTPQKMNLEEAEKLVATTQVGSLIDHPDSDECTATDLSENDELQNDEQQVIPNVGPHKTNLETYFRHNYDFDKQENRFIQEMVTICDNQCNDVTFIGMCKTIVKQQKVNNALKQQLLSMKNSRELAMDRHMAKVNDLKQFLKVKVVNLFRYKFIMVS